MIRNSLICKLINVQASMKENKEKKIKSLTFVDCGQDNKPDVSRKSLKKVEKRKL